MPREALVAGKNSNDLARILRQCLDEGRTVEIDGLGLFRPAARGGYEFQATNRAKVFLAYVQEDLAAVEKLYRAFFARGFDPWLDRKKLLPGQNWPRAIERAIDLCDFFVACFSHRAVLKPGQFHSELRYALDCAARRPLEHIFFIPVRLDPCDVPARITREIQYVDLFPDWDHGVRRILAAMENQKRGARRQEKLRLAG
jgi:hypothetical protein